LIHDESALERKSERAHRLALARNLFYRFALSALGENVPPHLRSAAVPLQRGVSSGTQQFSFDESTHWPVSQPLPKRSAVAQVTGSAQFTDDIPLKEGTVFAALVTSTVACGRILELDADEALQMDSVLAFYSAEDIPGRNSLTPRPTNEHQMLILAHGHVNSYGQPIGLVLASSPQRAREAALRVRVVYEEGG
jgi:xanthine dehydrogenase/oxidase